VLDNGDVDRPKSWIGKLPYFDKEMPGSRFNFGSTLEPGHYWVAVQYGFIMLGRGSDVGKQVLLMAHDPSPVMGVRYFGFGTFNRRTGQPERPTDMVCDISVNASALPQYLLPNCWVSCAPHDPEHQMANIHQMTAQRMHAAGLSPSKRNFMLHEE
jgi:hypothetical protein